jgi:hypothetical protein
MPVYIFAEFIIQCESQYTPNMPQHTSLTTNKYENVPVYSLSQCSSSFFSVTQNKGKLLDRDSKKSFIIPAFVKHENIHIYTYKFEPFYPQGL